MDLPGHRVEEHELRERGFSPLRLKWDPHDIVLPNGVGCTWTTEGPVPDSPGLYAFTAEKDNVLSVTYVGMTQNLWMVTKGRLPSGAPRPAQRYGRPRYAGATRQRINMEIRALARQGVAFRHWIRPVDSLGYDRTRLALMEEELIQHWQLRSYGWNRG